MTSDPQAPKDSQSPGRKENSTPRSSSETVVAVFGAAFLTEGGPAARTAFGLGGEIARRGWTLACGGYAGTMAAASRGAAEAGGRVIGVTCDTLSLAGRRTNPWITEEIRRPTARDRLLTLCRMADAAVALDGGIGTLSEIAFFASQIQSGELSPRPLLLLGKVWISVWRGFFHSADEYLTDEDKAIFQFASSPAEAVKIIKDRLRRGRTP